MYDRALEIVAETRNASISYLQRRLKVGYNRAARMVEQMESEGVVGPQEGTKPRDVYVRPIGALE
jgi:S-DNA-T family DNA segregation ATPase FtsK/SpoIIIE